ncbi:hypothetical protein C6B38_04675 [Spiroplasma sp. ChiS]|uniref:pentapeptide repeat-containing protein n=1 Tax=Spiroplasma sp. ChiS TaxID=2099885 RepID=UPI000CF88A9D|nr:pentapeptide repeat-containing protein [Spiroplasma sp. ChiS]PQP78455.1 hypothetical protein C6B38_05900 [Spiroplasma sp. ChiS]PQP78651.1 hypothetical protein C6B38_04675 [Spiroplasma sp. ChiS]
MKTLQDLIKDLTGITVEQEKINEYLASEKLDLQGANLEYACLRDANLSYTDLRGVNLSCADLEGIKITKQQLEQLTVIEENE